MESAFHALARAARPKVWALVLLLVLLAAGSPVAASDESADVPVPGAGEQEAEAPDALAAAEAELLAGIDTRHDELRQLEAALRGSEGEDRRGLEEAENFAKGARTMLQR